MALQGTLDTFELPDVLRLLASTGKSGRLTLRSDRGVGDVWLADGKVVGVSAPGVPGEIAVGEGLFELLRAREGNFAFEPGDEPASPLPPSDVEPLLAAAEVQLVEWREIEAVVPSLSSWLALAPELPAAEVTVDADTWRLVATIGSGLTVGELGDQLELAEVAVSRLVRELVELGLGAVGAPPAHAAPERPTPMPERDFEPVPAYSPEPELTPEPAPEPSYDRTPEPPAFEPSYDRTPEPPAPLFAVEEPFGYGDLVSGPDPEPAYDDEPIARPLSMLSPRAAEAMAAVSTPDVDDLDEADEFEDDEPNRGALLKFLGSVKG